MLQTMLTYEMIINAQKGDPYAMQQILSHYAGYSIMLQVSCIQATAEG